MNWILDTYSNVYQTAMMQPHEIHHVAAPAKKTMRSKASALLGLLSRR